MRSPFRGVLAAAVIAVLAAAAVLSAREVASRRLHDIDPLASFQAIVPTPGAIFIEGLSLPGMGLQADSVWVFLQGMPFHPEPVLVTVKNGVFNPVDGEARRANSEGTVYPAVSLAGISLGDGTRVFAMGRSGDWRGSLQGNWGSADFHLRGDSVFSVFTNITGLPRGFPELPPMAGGHSVSGFCRGYSGEHISASGELTSFDGEPASAVFSYSTAEDRPTASFSMDFSQVGSPAMAVLDSLAGGAVMTAVPTGSLSVTLSGEDSVCFRTELTFDSLVVFDPSIAPDTFSTRVHLLCAGKVFPRLSSLSVDTGSVVFGTAGLHFNLSCSWNGRKVLFFNAWNDSLAGSDITGSVPAELMGRLRGLSLSGHLSFSTSLVLDWDHPDSCDVQLNVDASRLMVGWSPVSFTALRDSSGGAVCTMRDSWGNTRQIPLDTLHNPDFIVYDSLPVFFEPVLCCAEDASFRRHHGFSEYHIRNSIRADMEEGRFVRGGSTLSMQLTKNLFLGREKNLARKLQEVFLTWRLERWLSKDRILEIYANIVELGPDVFGFNEAGMYYFNEPLSALSLRETAFLVSILPGPSVYHRFGAGGGLPGYWSSYVERLVTICGNRGWVEMSLVEEALRDTLVFDGPVREFSMITGGSHGN